MKAVASIFHTSVCRYAVFTLLVYFLNFLGGKTAFKTTLPQRESGELSFSLLVNGYNCSKSLCSFPIHCKWPQKLKNSLKGYWTSHTSAGKLPAQKNARGTLQSASSGRRIPQVCTAPVRDTGGRSCCHPNCCHCPLWRSDAAAATPGSAIHWSSPFGFN